MNKTLIALGYVFLVLVVVLILGIGFVVIGGRSLDRESKAFVDEAIPAIALSWDVMELQKRASPEFNDTADIDELWRSFERLRQLGELREYKGSAGEASITVSIPIGYELTADYDASVEFEAGSVDLQLTLIKQGGRWLILGFKAYPKFYGEDKDFI